MMIEKTSLSMPRKWFVQNSCGFTSFTTSLPRTAAVLLPLEEDRLKSPTFGFS